MFTQQPRALAGSLLLVPLLLGAAPVGAQRLTHVPTANPRIAGVTLPTKLSVELAQSVAAQGSMPVENPLDSVNFYGYLGDQPNLVPALGSNVEASKTEPDKNTYLVLRGQKGADASYDYGQHFLFQGHEGPGSGPSAQQGSITRINLDADAARRVTVLATRDRDNVRLPTFDGSTWNPFARRLLFTAEGNGTTTGGVWQATVEFPSIVENLLGVLGRGGFEGIQNDSAGNLWVVEDIGGATVAGARLPNSFILRFVPNNPRDLRQGKDASAAGDVAGKSGAADRVPDCQRAHARPQGSAQLRQGIRYTLGDDSR